MNDSGQEVSTEVLHKEIDLIQSCITRMAKCSFSLKGWYISLVTVALTLLVGQGCKMSIVGLLLFGVTTIFWGLDGFFLQMETFYRWKYDWVIKARMQGNKDYLYNLNPTKKEMWIEPETKKECLVNFVLSKTLFPIYGIVWGISISILLYVIMAF